VVAVGGVVPDGSRWACSPDKDYIDVLAPADGLLAATTGPDVVAGGTSLAGPLIAGLVAIVLSQRPTMAPADIRAALHDSLDERGRAQPFRDGRLVPLRLLQDLGLLPEPNVVAGEDALLTDTQVSDEVWPTLEPVELAANPDGGTGIAAVAGILGEPVATEPASWDGDRGPEDPRPPPDEPRQEPDRGQVRRPECWSGLYGLAVWEQDDEPLLAVLYAAADLPLESGETVPAGALLGYRAFQDSERVVMADGVAIGETQEALDDRYVDEDGHPYRAVRLTSDDGDFELASSGPPPPGGSQTSGWRGPELGRLAGVGDPATATVVERGDGDSCGLDVTTVSGLLGDATSPDDDEGDGGPDRDPARGECGLRVGIVLDRSPSIAETGSADQVRGAATALVDALGGSGAEVRISAFAGSPASLTSGWVSLLEPDGRRLARQAVANMAFTGTGTNWEAALDDLSGQGADVVVLVTDRLPNEYGVGISGQQSSEGTTNFDPVALSAGVAAADGLRAEGARIVAVGAGPVRADSLAQVAGPTQGEDYHLGDVADLGPSLTAIVNRICGTSLTVLHQIEGVPTGNDDYTLRIGDAEPRVVSTDDDGTAYVGLGPDVTGSVTLQGPDEMRLLGATCERGGREVEAQVDERTASITVDVAAGPTTCRFDWRALTVAYGPGVVHTLAFEPRPGVPDVTGCLGAGTAPDACDAARFGISFEDGFVMIRYDDSCAGCPDPDTFAVTGDADGIRFLLDVGGGLGTSDHLDLTVRASRQGDIRLSGSVHPDDALQVDVDSPGTAPCLADVPAGGRGNRRIETGTGC
jgi:subtilase family protein